jgi:hypothetical protein
LPRDAPAAKAQPIERLKGRVHGGPALFHARASRSHAAAAPVASPIRHARARIRPDAMIARMPSRPSPFSVCRPAPRTYRFALLGAIPAFALAACAGGSKYTLDAPDTQRRVLAEASAVSRLAATAISGHDLRADGGWFSCMGDLALKFDGGGAFSAPAGDVSTQLAAIRSALIGAGYADLVQAENQLNLARRVSETEWVAINISHSPVRAKHGAGWAFSFRSNCRPYSRRDKAWIKGSPHRVPLDLSAPSHPRSR